jgi:hypothetical protein
MGSQLTSLSMKKEILITNKIMWRCYMITINLTYTETLTATLSVPLANKLKSIEICRTTTLKKDKVHYSNLLRHNKYDGIVAANVDYL